MGKCARATLKGLRRACIARVACTKCAHEAGRDRKPLVHGPVGVIALECLAHELMGLTQAALILLGVALVLRDVREALQQPASPPQYLDTRLLRREEIARVAVLAILVHGVRALEHRFCHRGMRLGRLGCRCRIRAPGGGLYEIRTATAARHLAQAAPR